jgi:hypothetical protein
MYGILGLVFTSQCELRMDLTDSRASIRNARHENKNTSAYMHIYDMQPYWPIGLGHAWTPDLVPLREVPSIQHME